MPLADFNPNRYIFSFIPANIWNVFVTYLLLQDSHISYSVDIILSDLVRSLSNKPYYSNINYIYTDRWNHTSNLYKRSHIINLTRLDGWDFLANKFIFIFNARIDFLVYAKYFSNFFDNKNYIHKLHSALENLRNTYRFKYLWTLIYLIFNKLIKIKFLQNKNYFNKIRYTSLIIYKCVRIEDATDLITLIYDLKNISHLHLLQKRFDFWIKILES
jgi:hypothetical protein